jgi:hypothetical protein
MSMRVANGGLAFARAGTCRVPAACLVAALASPAAAQDAAALAKELGNPIAALISVPCQMNWDRDIGPDEAGRRFTMNVQPVVPVDLSRDWNLISRTILPVIDQSDIAPGAGSQTGIGDVVQSLFFSPKKPTDSGWIRGAGPVFLLPTGSDALLTTDKWGLGPTAVALRQDGPWTYGALANHIWSVGGPSGRPDVDSSFLQPFLVCTTPTAWSVALQAEATRDWERSESSIPVACIVSKVFKIGAQTVQVGGGPRYYVDRFDDGPKGWGVRFAVTLLFPR